MRSRNLEGRTAIVTGASRRQGIGAAICHRLAQAGANIFFTHWQSYDRTMPWGAAATDPQQLQQELLALGVEAIGAEVDLSNADAPKSVIEQAFAHFDNVSILVNNAAYSVADSVEGLNAAILDATYAVNLRATALLSVEFARCFSQETGGRIINLTSGQFQAAMVGEIAYAATKGAIDALTITLAAEVAEQGITVNAVNPGPTDSGWVTPTLRQELLPRFPMRRLGEPDDAARLARYGTKACKE
ncbi:SDR family NAD(P)-dependent oxidoreductase [Phormidium tenue FACHB-886]|nr:SDR family NAD(P)-dependent oxidoreductase [Phormidium tenue FACHB-886]